MDQLYFCAFDQIGGGDLAGASETQELGLDVFTSLPVPPCPTSVPTNATLAPTPQATSSVTVVPTAAPLKPVKASTPPTAAPTPAVGKPTPVHEAQEDLPAGGKV
eukprot:gene12000-biopygen8777